jgi:hypothetical protein
LSDDILIFGNTKTEHDASLLRVLKRLKTVGLTANEKNGEFSKVFRFFNSLFFGYHFSKDGISIQRSKVEALKIACEFEINTDNKAVELSKMPDTPWEELSCDFYGPLKNGKYVFVMIDDHSRYPIAKTISSTSAKKVTPLLD